MLERFQADTQFVDGASRYWGEVLRRSARSRWTHDPRERTDLSTTIGYFWLYQPFSERTYTLS
ncbi:hypothetical protein [Allokutzneria albata]|uniref:hypothetical protein n=1 Tax=Allokutzneria albata TaxID=211114 RepID=UPI0012DC16E2|nr:hypothetical protein [Allokutzneria albata]